MAKIRYLNLFDIFNLKKLVSHLTEERFFDYTSELIFHPLSVINYVLPVGMKFLPDSFVAVQDGEIKGMLSIKPRKNNHLKWKIQKLLLNEDAYDIGEQLINFVVSRYGAKGVETVEVDINSKDSDIIDLFSKACGFRYCLDYQHFKLNTDYYKNREINCETLNFRPFKLSDCKNVSELYNQNISTYYKFPLSRNEKEFLDSMCSGLSKKSNFKYILEDKFSKQIRGYIQIETIDNTNFVIEIAILESFENYFEEVICFAISQIKKRTNHYNVYFKNCKFHINSNYFEEKLMESELLQTDMIFVKDFFRQIKDSETLAKPAIIYNEISGKPAFKI